jgi:chaperonin GroEL
MIKEIKKGHEARLKIKEGVDKACDAVRPTLGPIGMTALIEFAGLDPVECDDGVTILKNLEFKDHYENMGLQMLRKAALRTSTEGGDGTATTTVLTQALVAEAFKEISDDSSKIREVRERLANGLSEALSKLTALKREVTEDDIERIATISSLDADVAKLISEVIKEVGVNGVVTVEKGHKIGYSKEVVKGARFDRGLISPFFINDREHGQTVLENPYIVLADRKISTNEQILSLLNSIGTGKHILFIADDVDSVALATLAQNALGGIANIACVRNPYSASRASDFLFDIAALTGATVISEQRGMRLDTSTVELCGRAEKVVITKNSTTIIGGSPTTLLNERIQEIQGLIEATTSEYERAMLEDRLAALTGGIGVIRVGAYTDTEFNAKKYKFENAINATQAALQEGVLPGGGTALYSIIEPIKEPIFKNALRAPLVQMIKNAGIHENTALATLDINPPSLYIDRAQIKVSGMNFVTKGYVPDMVDAGIIDPFKVTRLALESATAIASSLVGIETVIAVVEEPKTNE